MEERNVILMVHGMWCGKWVWDDYKEFFREKGFVCVAPDLRFHGEYLRNPNPDLGTTSLLDYAEDLEEVILALKGKYGDWPIGMGHSMGGLLVQILASRGLLKAMVLLAPAAPRGIFSTEESVLNFFLPMLISEGPKFRKRILRPDYKNVVYSMLDKFSEKEQRAIYRRLCHESGRTIFEIGFWEIEWFRRAAKVKYKKINCPTYIVVGEEDKVTPMNVVRKNVKKYKKLSLDLIFKTYPNHSHWLLSEPGWEKIIEDVWGWLESLTNLQKRI